MKRNTLFFFILCAITALGATTALGIVKATPVAPAAMSTACTFTWDGSAGSDFCDPDNWTVTAGSCTTGTDYPNSVNHKAIITTDGTAAVLNFKDCPNITLGELVVNANATFTVQNIALNEGEKLTITSSGKQNGKLTITADGTMTIASIGKVVLADSVTHPISGVLDIDSGGLLEIQAGTVNLLSSVTHSISGVLEIDSGAILDIQAGTVDLDSANTHPIGGVILLSNSDSILLVSADGVILDVNNSVYGSIEGQHNDAKVLIDEPSSGTNTLTSNITFEGQMKVERGVDAAGTASFVNGSTGQVLANVANGTLHFADLDLSGGGDWKAEAFGSAVLEFDTADTSGLEHVHSKCSGVSGMVIAVDGLAWRNRIEDGLHGSPKQVFGATRQ